MPKLTSEANFESAIEAHLLAPQNPSRYLPAKPEEYDRDLCLIPASVLGFLRASQPDTWKSFKDRLGEGAEAAALKRIRTVIERKGTLHALRKGFDESGHHFDLCYFQPTSGLNPDLQKLYQGNVLQVMRQWKFSKYTEESIDNGIFLNGLPIFTAELKNPLSGQNAAHAIAQYRARDPKEGLFAFGRILAHFAVDPEQVYFATTLAGKKTEFVPFNQGCDGGAGNPPSATGFATAYLWQDIWSRPSLLDLLQRFIQVMPILDDKGRDTGKKRQVFPRYHQLTTVREVTGHARQCGAGHSYLNQHNAGSGKTLEIATLANSLATLHTAQDKPVFSSVIVVSDRRVIDRQLQRTILAFTSEKAMVEVIDEGKTSRDLKDALLDGKKIIVSTIQKFPRILEDLAKLGKLPGNSFAVIIDEAHSSQAGDAAEAVNRVFSYGALEKTNDEKEEETWEDRVVELMKRRGRMKHVSFFAFTATPKPETLELFKTKLPDGKWRMPFTLYTMRQAIEEGFILDVLKNYTTYDQYFNLLKTIAEDPQYDHKKATALLKQFVGLHKHTVDKKARIMVDHFRDKVQTGIEGKAKAMIVTRSRLHAVRYALAVRAYLKELGSPFKALVAFTGTVKDPDTGKEYTETGMNGVSDTRTEMEFEADENKLLIVANKFQTGFDQPLLAAIYVDRKLKGVTAVQTLSRLNRTRPGKKETFVLDFENDRGVIQEAFQVYYDRVSLTKDTDPNRLYDILTDLGETGMYTAQHVTDFCRIAFSKLTNEKKIAQLHGLTNPIVAHYQAQAEEDRRDFKSKLRDFVKLYSFLSQIITFQDPKLEQFFAFGDFLVKKLPPEPGELPYDILSKVDLDLFKPQQVGTAPIPLQRGDAKIEPPNYGGGVTVPPEDIEPLSKIIAELNEQFGTRFTDEDRVVIKRLEDQLTRDKILEQQLQVGSKDAVRLSFEQVAQDMLHALIDSNFKFYKKVQDDQDIARELFDRLFERYYARKAKRS